MFTDEGDLASTLLETRHHRTTCERPFVRSLANPKAQVVSFAFHTHTPTCQPERNDVAYSLLQTTMEPLPHGLLVLSSSKPLTGRTGLQTEGRFSLLELLEIHPGYRNTPTTGQGLIVLR